MNTIFLDFHGTIYFHHQSLDINKSSEVWESKINEAVVSYPDVNVLDLECKLVLENTLPIYFIPDAKSKILEILKDNEIVTSSSSRIEEQKYILFSLLGISNKEKITYKDFSEYGEKNDPKAWKKLILEFPNLTQIYEDKTKYISVISDVLCDLGKEYIKLSKTL